MSEHPLEINLDLLAEELKAQMKGRGDMSVRAASTEIGCSPTTLARLLSGAETPNVPDSKTILQAVSWLRKSIYDFAKGRVPESSTIGDVVVHLRAVPDLNDADKDALEAMIKAAHNAYRLRSSKS